MNTLRKLFRLAACALLLSGCATQSGVTLPPLPAWIAPAGAKEVPAITVVLGVVERLPGVPLHYSDRTYTVVSRAWLDRYVDWTWAAARAARVEYVAESFDCENFTGLFSELASLAAAKAGVKASPLVAKVVVEHDIGRHELAGVVTDAGVFIVEPQPAAGPFRIWPLGEYPRRILSITFGSFNPR